MSKQHVSKAGESLETVAARVYGDPALAGTIAEANLAKTTNADGELAVGTTLTIPDLPEETALKTGFAAARLEGKSPDQVTIIVDGVEIIPLTVRVFRAIDTGTNACTFTIPWTDGARPDIDAVTKPYQYKVASIYIGGKLMINGVLYTVNTELTEKGRTKTLVVYSFTADAVDSVMKPPYEFNDVSLEQVAPALLGPVGIGAEFSEDTGGPFFKVTARPTDTIFHFLSGLAKQRGFLATTAPSGNMLFTKTTPKGPVAVIREGDKGVLISGGSFDGRKRFNVYRAIGQSPGENAKPANSVDGAVPRSRFMTFSANDTVVGDIQKAADWRKTKSLADALTLSIPVTGWGHDGGLWRENTKVTVISPTLFLPGGATLLIRSVESVLDANGRTTILNVVPPEVYLGAGLVDPWA